MPVSLGCKLAQTNHNAGTRQNATALQHNPGAILSSLLPATLKQKQATSDQKATLCVRCQQKVNPALLYKIVQPVQTGLQLQDCSTAKLTHTRSAQPLQQHVDWAYTSMSTQPPGSTHHHPPSRGCAGGCTTPEELPNSGDEILCTACGACALRNVNPSTHTVPYWLVQSAHRPNPCLPPPKNPRPNHLASLCRCHCQQGAPHLPHPCGCVSSLQH